MRHGQRNTQIPLKETTSHPAKIVAAQHEAIVLNPSMSATEAFVAVARACIDHIAGAVEAAQRSDDPEAIHQLRVGARRLRAAFSVFSAALPRRRPAVLRQLHMLQQQLGAARELDVLLDETIASLPDDLRGRRGMQELIKSAEARRTARHRHARATLASKRCTNLWAQLPPAIDRYAWHRAQGSAAGEEPVTGFAAKVMRSRHRKARRLGDKIRDRDPEELHALRISIKKLRYAVEFFQDLWPRRRTQRYLLALKDLQQLLGNVHDTTVAASLVTQITRQRGIDAERAAMLVERWAHRCLKRDSEKLPDLWRRFTKQGRPWKDA